MNNETYTVINEIYRKSGYLDKYGGSLWVTVILLLVFFIIISYYHVYNNLQPIKADWANNVVIPE